MIISKRLGDAEFIMSKDELTYSAVIEDFKNASQIHILTYNISKDQNVLLKALRDCEEDTEICIVSNIPGRWESYFGKTYADKAKRNISLYISNIEDQVLSMYAKGMTTRDISAHLKDVYGVDASAEMISHMTDRILPIAKEWQNRPLERKYAIVFMDAVHFHVREDNRTVKKAVYVAIGVKLNGKREVLGMWVGGNESAKYWLSVLNEIKNRGVEDIMIVSVDGLSGFGDAIHAVFPQAEIQRCIVHQIRYSTKFISYKDLRPFMADLKLVYKADTEDLALTALDDLEEKWGKKYPASIGSWRNNWTQLSTYFKYPSEIRKLIYTTNSIENFNRQLRKVTKSKTIFPTDDALFKMLYLAMMDATKKWTGKAWDWGLTLDQLCIYFGDRIQPEDID